jgi:hypothetical protein
MLMTKNWLRFICFCVIFTLLFGWVNSALSVPSRNWTDFYKLPRNSVDVLFIGNSHNIESFQPQIINDVVPVNSYLLGIQGENIFISYYELREVLKTQQPKLVVLETFTLDLTRPVELPLIFPFTDAGTWDLNKLAVLNRFLPRDILFTAIPSLRAQTDWSHPGDFFTKMAKQLKPKSSKIDPELGAMTDPEPLSEAEYLAALDSPVTTVNNSQVENRIYLDKFVELCKENDIKLLLVTAPIMKITGETFTYYTPFDVTSYAKEKGIDLLTFDTSNFNKMHFANPDHLSVFGSVIISVDTALEISKILDLPIDQDQLSYYQSFYFSDFSLSRKDDYYTLTLIPERPDAALRYKFTLMDSDYKALSSTDWQQSNQYQIDSANNIVHIQVLIAGPSGEYQIKGYFNNY